ncbi:hypothetical protein [Arcobacter caeni]|uniref:Pentapeptide repeat-containing protein n=1 Tax=Arcobacter caeni TaxID=1912877 RepID=A0A363D3Z7_9BACT|nr:hypothetical protein [Arcobacter caeni]PUE66066.1 hypothetical protein B0174_02020 [Arcobacter caeni]
MEEIKKYTCKYESCNKEFDEKEFQITKNENKCILHCEKDDSKNMNFWNEFSSYIDSDSKESIKISNFIFPCVYKENFEELLNKNYSQISFYECQFNNIDLNGMIFNSNILFKENINFEYTTFEKLAIFKNSNFEKELTFGILIYKITIAYLIYQLIISIRQNTRRK